MNNEYRRNIKNTEKEGRFNVSKHQIKLFPHLSMAVFKNNHELLNRILMHL